MNAAPTAVMVGFGVFSFGAFLRVTIRGEDGWACWLAAAATFLAQTVMFASGEWG